MGVRSPIQAGGFVCVMRGCVSCVTHSLLHALLLPSYFAFSAIVEFHSVLNFAFPLLAFPFPSFPFWSPDSDATPTAP